MTLDPLVRKWRKPWIGIDSLSEFEYSCGNSGWLVSGDFEDKCLSISLEADEMSYGLL